jgi:hypothetical protein
MAIEDTFIPVYYRIEIDGSGLGGTAPDDGFIDNQRAREYDPLPSTLDASRAKERGNVRYGELIRQLSDNISPVNHTPRQIVAPGRDGDTPPTSFDFTVVFDRPEYLRTEDETNPGTFLTGVDAVTRFVARALVQERYDNREIYNPTAGNFSLIENLQTGALAADVATAEGNITVTEIANT